LTQTGIAQAVDTDQSYTSYSIKKSLEKGLVKECIGRTKSGKRKQKYFLLTYNGIEHTQELKKNLSNLTIRLKHSPGALRIMRIRNIIPYLERKKICPDITEVDLYNNISKSGTVDIEALRNIKKAQFYDFSVDAPIITHFFGRKRELALLEKWVEDREGHNIIFIHGMPGIGKTTLAAKLIEKYRESKHLYWHSFHELDTLRGVLLKLNGFLSKLGYDQLEMHLRMRKNLDYYKVSKILEKSIGTIDAILIFDNFQKSNDKIRAFFIYIYRMLLSSSKTKMLILSREIVTFFDGSDVILGKAITELELKGLDFENSKKILKEKGFDRKKFEDIYKQTDGNPLLLEILGGSKNLLDKFIHDELFSKLNDDEKKILSVISVYRIPVPEDCLAMNDDVDFETLFMLIQKSLVKQVAKKRYFLHDLVKKFFYKWLSSSERKKHHLFAARWYENRDEYIDIIEAIYHYQEAGEYKKASQIAIDISPDIFDGGYIAEFQVILERFDEENLETNDWADILILKGKTYYICGEWKKALLYLTQSADVAYIIGDKKL